MRKTWKLKGKAIQDFITSIQMKEACIKFTAHLNHPTHLRCEMALSWYVMFTCSSFNGYCLVKGGRVCKDQERGDWVIDQKIMAWKEESYLL